MDRSFIVRGATIVLLLILLGFILPTLSVNHPQTSLIWLSRTSLFLALGAFFIGASTQEPIILTLTSILTGITLVLVLCWKIQTVNQTLLVEVLGVCVCIYVLYSIYKIIHKFAFGVPVKPIDL